MFNASFEYPVKYDNRFGMAEYLGESNWMCAPERHGETWKFNFPNGYTVSVARTACWSWDYVRRNVGCTAGFGWGYYETICYPTSKGMMCSIDTDYWLDYEQVQQKLERVKALDEFNDEEEGGCI